MTRLRLVLLTESPTEGDALARFLRQVPWIEVAAEVADLASFHRLPPLPAPDLVLVNDRLPGNHRPEATIGLLAERFPGVPILRIAPGPLPPRPSRHVRRTLTGEFTGREILEAIRQAAGHPEVLAVGALLPGAGATSTVIVLAHAALHLLPEGTVVVRDDAERKLIARLLQRHPILRHPRLTDAGQGVLTIVDIGAEGGVPREATRVVGVVPPGLRADVAPHPLDRFGLTPDVVVSPPVPSPVVSGKPPEARVWRRFAHVLGLAVDPGWSARMRRMRRENKDTKRKGRMPFGRAREP